MSTAASFEALTPTSFLLRSGRVYADRGAVIDGERRFSYAELLDRCLRLGGALRNMGVAEGGGHWVIKAQIGPGTRDVHDIEMPEADEIVY